MFMRLLRLGFFTLFWSLLVCLVLLIVADNIGNELAPPPFIIGLILLVVVIGGVLVWTNRWVIFRGILSIFPRLIEPARRNQRDGLAVLAYVEQAIRMNVPLSPILEAAAKTERNRLAWRLERLRELIDAGVDLPMALQQEVPEISDRAIGLIAAGESTGQLQSVLARLLAEGELPMINNEYDAHFALIYTVMMLIGMTFILAILGIFVEPKFRDILHDFHMQPPAINQWVISTTMACAPIAAVVVLVLLVIWFIYGLWVMIWRPRGVPRNIWGILMYGISQLPWIGDSQRDRSWADVCRVLADSFAAGWPTDAALAQAQQLSLVPRVRSAVRRWNIQVQGGAPLGEAAGRAALPGMFVGILAAAGDQSAAALEFLNRYYANRFSRLRILLRGALIPAAVLFFATCVALIALSVFLPIIEMINHLAGWVGGMK
jgi:type II secretory pathway component PulF